MHLITVTISFGFCILVLVFVILDFLVFRYKWDTNEKHLKPETGLLQLREALKLFANLRPASVIPQVIYGQLHLNFVDLQKYSNLVMYQ